MNIEMLVDKTFSRKLYEYKDACYLMRTVFPQNEQIPMWLLRVLAFRKNVNFRAFYDDDQFCGVLYTAEDNKYIFVLYLAVNDRIRSKGYGTKILDWLKQNTEKEFFYNQNGIFDTECRFIDEGETCSVLASDIEHFNSKEYEMLLSRFSFGTYKKHITR